MSEKANERMSESEIRRIGNQKIEAAVIAVYLVGIAVAGLIGWIGSGW